MPERASIMPLAKGEYRPKFSRSLDLTSDALRVPLPVLVNAISGDTRMLERILVVEDDARLRHALSRELEAAGYDVEQAHDYRDALEVLEDGKRISVLLVDLILPGVNGFALARMARMRSHNLRIIYLTGTDDVPITKPTDQYSTSRSTRPCCCQRSGIACAQSNPTFRDQIKKRCRADGRAALGGDRAINRGNHHFRQDRG